MPIKPILTLALAFLMALLCSIGHAADPADGSHGVPGSLHVITPQLGESLALDAAAITWTPSQRAVQYLVEIGDMQQKMHLELALPAACLEFTIPAELLEAGACYEYSLTAQGLHGAETRIEGGFDVVR